MIATFVRGSIDGSVVHGINVDASVVKRRFRPGAGGGGWGQGGCVQRIGVIVKMQKKVCEGGGGFGQGGGGLVEGGGSGRGGVRVDVYKQLELL